MELWTLAHGSVGLSVRNGLLTTRPVLAAATNSTSCAQAVLDSTTGAASSRPISSLHLDPRTRH